METQIKLITSLRKLYKSETHDKKKCRAYCKACLNTTLRKISNDKPVKYVSKAAKAKAKLLGIDLVTMTWDNQTKKNYDPKRVNFKYEHCIPIKELIERVLDTDEPIESIIEDDFVCWVLVEEDKELRIHGYQSKRPGGWKKCYKECGIVPILNK